jgi:hypothetical protein
MGRFAHITLGKAGSQWVKDVLTDPQIFAAQDLRLFQPRGPFSMAAFAAEPDRTLVAPAFHVTHEEWRAFSAAGDRCIVVLRDPRDSIVSWAFSVAYSHVTEDHIGIIRPAMLALDLRGKLEVSMYTYWESAHVQRSWAGHVPTATERVFRYEDIVADEHAAFRSMVDHFQWDVAPGDLAEVVDRLTFRRRSGGRERGEKNLFNHLRNGVPGDWKNYFDRDLGERFERSSPGLLTALGYETRHDWWTQLPVEVESLSRDEKPDVDALDSVRAELARARASLAASEALTEQLMMRIERLGAVEHQVDTLMRRLAPEAAR